MLNIFEVNLFLTKRVEVILKDTFNTVHAPQLLRRYGIMKWNISSYSIQLNDNQFLQ
jgi:hypothetical protein